ncbi:MAG: tRNA (adenosine(37)-N6)-threonylcarbamoyltransferase complex ATPase subunit type 1 TsaE [Chitinispirillia bacterium]|nr:tRNA (adenosine(37)-N6)-threonylcarbamoyltransferase complex ATPase subunit type 1 TsaE [Chitinispirillia bacterium]
MITKVMKVMRERSASVEETRALGARLARLAEPGDVFSFDGDLGAGKTEFVRGFVEALAAGADVRSPTFSIVNTYGTPKFPVYHFDFYRIEDPREFRSVGLDEYLNGDGVCLIEWGSKFLDVLPPCVKFINFSEGGESVRIIESHFMF